MPPQLTRRQFLGATTALAASSPAFATAMPSTAKRPRALVHILLRGGIDAILSTDPKRTSQVEARVDLPYREDQIVTGGGTSVGPLFKPFAPLLPRMAILNGVIGGSVAHDSAEQNTLEMRRVFPVPADTRKHRDSGFGLVGTLGALRPSETGVHDLRFFYPYKHPAGRSLVAMRFGIPLDQAASGTLVAKLSQLARDGVRRPIIDRVLERELASCRASQTGGCDALDAARTLLAHMPDEALPEPARLTPLDPNAVDAKESLVVWATILRDTIFALRHRLTRSVFIYAPIEDWDSHNNNLFEQNRAMASFAPAFLHLMSELDRVRTVDGVRLSDEVGVVFSSEIGRFPVKNEHQGKDHFPELPVVLLGPGIRPGQYGATDAQMVATPISNATGRPSSGPKDFVPTVDDIGATILNWYGIEDTRSVGYLGRRLDFLLG